VKNPDALSGPSSSCFPHSVLKQEENTYCPDKLEYPFLVSVYRGRNSRIFGTVVTVPDRVVTAR